MMYDIMIPVETEQLGKVYAQVFDDLKFPFS